MYLSKLEALIERYFCNPERQITLEAGAVVIVQQGYNDRLFFVLQGELEGYFSEHEEKQVRVFSASKGAFIGVHSFFSGTWTASSTVMAKSEVTLAWIDRSTPAVEVEEFGPLTTQFMPVIVNELSRRQRR
ncbi:cyclic nucleotide-binding domain-containing protein, partial [Vibrio vulnificus]